MWTLSDVRRFFGRRALRAAALLLVLGLPAALTAAWAAPQEGAAVAGDRSELRQLIEKRYTVLPISGGLLLTPRAARAGVRTIEITGANVAINGERMPGERTIREWLEGDADLILRLRALSPDQQRQTFGLAGLTTGEQPAPAPEAAEDAAEAPTSGEVTEVTPGEEEEAAEPVEPEPPTEPVPPAESEETGRRSSGDRVNVGGSVKVAADEVTDEAVAIGGSVTVDGEVRDAVTAVGGSARINGRVGGEVVAVGGGVYLGPKAEVDGGVTSVGGRIHREPGAVIHGPTSEVGLLPFSWNDGWRHPWSFRGGVSDVMGSMMNLVVMGLLVCLILLVARRPLERVDRMLATQPWQSTAVGVAGFVFLAPLLVVVTVLLVITIVGCTLLLLYPFLFLYIGWLFLLGYAAVAHRLDRWLEARFNRRFGSPYAAALVGVLAIQIWSVLGHILDLGPGPFGFFSAMVMLFGALMIIAAWIVGFGAVILARFGLEPGYWPSRAAAVTPPAPMVHPGSLPLTDPLTSPATDRWDDPGQPYPPESTEPPR